MASSSAGHRARPFDVFRAPVLAAEAAADVADVLARGQNADLSAHLKSRYPLPEAGEVGWLVFVALRDGSMVSKRNDYVDRDAGQTTFTIVLPHSAVS